MTDYIIHTETGHIYITPTGFLVHAKDYHLAGINWQTDGRYSPVPYFLISRSIELGLKAFCLANGEKMKEMRFKIGHNLEAALEKAKKYSLGKFVAPTIEEEDALLKANAFYSDKGFEYFDIKNIFAKDKLPDLKILEHFAERLLSSVTSFILNSA